MISLLLFVVGTVLVGIAFFFFKESNQLEKRERVLGAIGCFSIALSFLTSVLGLGPPLLSPTRNSVAWYKINPEERMLKMDGCRFAASDARLTMNCENAEKATQELERELAQAKEDKDPNSPFRQR